ncbi:MAG: glucose-6-phosphate dehydrogenase assembly protein OpcA [Acidothermus sp.]|nr:glucose-6-phosphate dehydrogenase assembly protein OpcA [Acidothermus sp.]MCL6538753.1 glucose-6-phosphate dehydrogenase assembly protein OpcA [Acidothermus sp.]
MNRDLTNTRAADILAALTEARRRAGVAALGMVLTLVVDVDEAGHYDAVHAAIAAAREHPCRIVTVIRRSGERSTPRLDAELRVGEETSLAEIAILRLYGPLRQHADSVVLPLLLPDAPVLVWWPGAGPIEPAKDGLGALAQRRVTDAAAGRDPIGTLRARAGCHHPGDTDFAWTRLTPWRTLLAAALDQPFDRIHGGMVAAARKNPSAELLAVWLEWRLGVPIERKVTKGPGITEVRLSTQSGDIAITRPDGRLATLSRPGQPDRSVPLPRRSTEELLAEEMRRLDPDDIYSAVLSRLAAQPSAEAASATHDAATEESGTP